MLLPTHCRAEVMITGDDDPPKMIGVKRHTVMTHSMDLSASSRVKKELLRQVRLSNDDSYIDKSVSSTECPSVCLSVCLSTDQ